MTELEQLSLQHRPLCGGVAKMCFQDSLSQTRCWFTSWTGLKRNQKINNLKTSEGHGPKWPASSPFGCQEFKVPDTWFCGGGGEYFTWWPMELFSSCFVIDSREFPVDICVCVCVCLCVCTNVLNRRNHFLLFFFLKPAAGLKGT